MMENVYLPETTLADHAGLENEAERLARLDMNKMTQEQRRELRASISELPDEEIRMQPLLCCTAARLAYAEGDAVQGRKWQNILISMRETAEEMSPRRIFLESCVCCAGLSAPGVNNAQIMMLLSILYNELAGKQYTHVYLSATGGRPSVLSGAKDFSEWGKNYRAVRRIICPLLDVILEDGGRGACEVAVAELFYEKNDMGSAEKEAADAAAVDSVEIAFAALAQLARINRLNSTAKAPEMLLEEIDHLIQKRDAQWLRPGFLALRARFDMEMGREDAVRQWLEESKAGLHGCSASGTYQLLTEAKACLTLERVEDAVAILDPLLYALVKEQRPLDTMECLVSGAIAHELQGERLLALKRMHMAIRMGLPFGYIRVFADYGRPVFLLVQRYMEAYPPEGPIMRKYLSRILNAADAFHKFFPNQYGDAVEKVGAARIDALQNQAVPPKARDVKEETKTVEAGGKEMLEKLTPTELTVLNLLNQGNTNDEIASHMAIKRTTVKFHVANIMGKLEAKNRTEAVVVAQKMGLLQTETTETVEQASPIEEAECNVDVE